MTIHAHLNGTTVGKKTHKNIIFYTHTISLLVIYSTAKQTVVIINCKCWSNFKILNKTNFL